MQFLLLKSKDILDNDYILKVKEIFVSTSSILCDYIDYEWCSSDKKSYFIARNPKLEIYEKYGVFNIDEYNNLSFIHGWLKKDYEDNLLDAKSLDDFDNIDGFFNAGLINNQGFGKIYSSKLHPSIYYAEANDCFALSNRISSLSKLFSYKCINKKYIATHIQYQSSAINYETMFENVYQIPFSSEVIIDEKLIINKVHDYLYDESLHELYLTDKNAYWDDCFKKMYSQVKAFVNLDVNDKFILGISGGKDSRLLLSLYNEYINSTFTWGSIFSPEMIVGKMVSDAVGLEHNFNKNTVRDYNYENLMESLPQHLFVREFEMCPWDFGGITYNTKETMTIDGQEYVRVKPLNEYEESVIHNMYLNQFKNNFAIVDEFNDLIANNVLEYVDEYLLYMNNLAKFSIIKRQLERGRWVSKVHETIFDHSFNIYPLLTNVALCYGYNISEDAMHNEEFHYELMKRAYPKLLNIPFFEDQLSLNPIPPIENKIPGKLNYKNVYLVKYFDYIFDYINENFDLISDVVKKDFIEGLTEDKIFNNSKLSQIIYNILQYIILLKNSDYENLKNKLDLNWDIDCEKSVDTFYNDLLKAYVEYNEDIVFLKKNNLNLKHQVDENLATIENLEKNISYKNKKISNLSNQLELYKKDFLDLNNDELKFIIDKYKLIDNQKILELTDELEHEKNKNIQTRRYLLFLENSLNHFDSLHLDFEELKNSYNCLIKYSDEKSSSIQYLNFKIDELSESINVLNEDIENKSLKIDNLTENIGILENNSQMLDLENKKLVSEIKNQNSKIVELDEIISNLKNEIKTLNNINFQLNEDNKKYKSELDELKSSASWKVTNSMKNVKNIFKDEK